MATDDEAFSGCTAKQTKIIVADNSLQLREFPMPEQPEREKKNWAVSVDMAGENVVTISSRGLSGRDLTPEDEYVIREAARHLLSFIGDGAGEFIPLDIPESANSAPSAAAPVRCERCGTTANSVNGVLCGSCWTQAYRASAAPVGASLLQGVIDARCHCQQCRDRTENIYRQVSGTCRNCGAGPFLILYREGDPASAQDCPRCKSGYKPVSSERPATADEIPAAVGLREALASSPTPPSTAQPTPKETP